MTDLDLISLLRICGVSASLASFTVLIADLLLLGGRMQSNEPNLFYRMTKKPSWSLFWGHALGVLAIPFCLPGLVLIGYALWPLGPSLAIWITVGLASLFLIGPFVHGLYAPLGAILREQSNGTLDDATAKRLASQLSRYLAVPAIPMLLVFMLASVALSTALLMGDARLPAWLGLWCLGPLMAALAVSNRFLPAALAGIAQPACVHVVYFPFIATATWLLWNG